jgi:hypothetical protein
MEYIRSFTKIPVPNVVAYDSSNQNALGFEWILMEFMHGTPLAERWRELPMTTKERLVRQLACYQAQLFAKQHNRIGNIYRAPSSPTQSQYSVSRIVSHDFFWGDHIHRNIPRGPFENSHDWLSARLALLRLDQQRVLESADSDEDDIEDASLCLSVVQKLLKLLPQVFPPAQREPTFLFHDDLSMHNVLVDEHGALTAVLDWECVSMLPLWRACQIPDLLREFDRHELPSPDTYFKSEGIINSLYWEHLLEFETTRLRKVFLSEMRRLCPKWVEVMDGSELQRDFETAVTQLNGPWAKVVNRWLDDIENGNPSWSLGTKFC